MVYPESSQAARPIIEGLFPHQIEISPRLGSEFRDVREEVIAWCVAECGTGDAFYLGHFGKDPRVDPNGRWCYGFGYFYFKSSDDAVSFRLRWC